MKHPFLVSCWLSCVMLAANGFAAEPAPPHDPVAGSDCATCHLAPVEAADALESAHLRSDPAAFRSDGTAMCLGCHDTASSHVVGVPARDAVPPDMPLAAGGVVTCTTCHYTHGSLSSDRPRASFSFTDRLTDSPRLRKSFLLRRDNSDGEMCRICHQPEKEGASP